MSPLRPIETVDQALEVMAYLAGWATPADSMDPYVVQVCYNAARDRTEGLSLSRARLMQAASVLEVSGIVVTRYCRVCGRCDHTTEAHEDGE